MGMEFYFLSVPREAFLRVQKSSAVESISLLSPDETPAGAAPSELREYFRCDFNDDEETVEDLAFLVEQGATPIDKFSLHRSQYTPLMALIKEAPTVFGNVFEGGHEIGTELDAIWGDDLRLPAAGLQELEVEGEELKIAVEWLREIFTRAVEDDWAIVRYMN